MRGLTKFLSYSLVSSLLIISISCDTKSPEVVNTKEIVPSIGSGPLSKEDSIILLARDLNIEFDENLNSVNEILEKVINARKGLVARLDSLDERADYMETMVYEFKRKEDAKIKKKLLAEIAQVKKELERIKILAGDAIKEDSTSVPEIKVPVETETFENLPPGNYRTRLDKYRIISMYIDPEGNIFFKEPVLDSTTVITGGRKLNPRVQKELESIKKKINDGNQ